LGLARLEHEVNLIFLLTGTSFENQNFLRYTGRTLMVVKSVITTVHAPEK